MTRDKCRGFTVHPPTAFYPIPWRQWKLYFDEGTSAKTMARLKNSLTIHVWNKFSTSRNITVGSRQPYGLIAQEFCPKVYSHCGPTFWETSPVYEADRPVLSWCYMPFRFLLVRVAPQSLDNRCVTFSLVENDFCCATLYVIVRLAKWLVCGLSPRRPIFIPRESTWGLAVDCHSGQLFFRCSLLPLSDIIPPKLHTVSAGDWWSRSIWGRRAKGPPLLMIMMILMKLMMIMCKVLP